MRAPARVQESTPDSENGFALIATILLTMVLLSLSLTAIALSLHNEFSSSYDRSHTQSVNAAEAGIDYADFVIQSTQPFLLSCNYSGLTNAVPQASYQVSISYYTTYPPSGSAVPCTQLSSSPTLAGAVVTSVGKAPANSSIANQRTMQEQVQLTPIYGGFTNAVYAYQLSSSLGAGNNSNQFTITAIGQGSNDADVYANQGWTCGKNGTIYGNVYSQSTISLGNNCAILGTAWAKGDVSLRNNSSVGVDVLSQGNLSMVASSVGGNVKLGGTCTGCTTGAGGDVGGSLTTNASVNPPPAEQLPTVTFNSAAFQAAGYSIKSYSGSGACSSAQSDLGAGFGNQSTVLVINSTCSLDVPSMSIGANLAIITDGQIVFGGQRSFSSTNATPPDLMFVIPNPLPSGETCSSITSPSIDATNNLNFSDVDFLLFTPCDIFMMNGFTASNNAGGQLYAGGDLNPGNNLTFNYVPVLIPGAGQVTGYNLNTAYLREIAN